MDKFIKWIKENKEHYALIDRSYKNVCQQKEKRNDIKVNTELATYGDAVLKLALCEILWEEEISDLTIQKEKYESDKVLVTVIAKHYDILGYIRFDENDSNMPKDYDYQGEKHKYIATAIESCLGAMYMDKTVSWEDIMEIVKEWKSIIDS